MTTFRTFKKKLRKIDKSGLTDLDGFAVARRNILAYKAVLDINTGIRKTIKVLIPAGAVIYGSERMRKIYSVKKFRCDKMIFSEDCKSLMLHIYNPGPDDYRIYSGYGVRRPHYFSRESVTCDAGLHFCLTRWDADSV
jgi:hypothetical protein